MFSPGYGENSLPYYFAIEEISLPKNFNLDLTVFVWMLILFLVVTAMADNPRGCQRVDDVIGNGRKKLLLIGKMGEGRSSLCNVIAGLEHDSAFFCVQENPELSSHAINFGEVLFLGDVQRPITGQFFLP